jgi:hypothetical protein
VWDKVESAVIRKDYFVDEHQLPDDVTEEGGTLLGGLLTVVFYLWSMGLLGLTAYLFIWYNDDIIQVQMVGRGAVSNAE